MNHRDQRLEELYQRFLANDLSASELDEFLQLIDHPSTDRSIREMMDHTWSLIHGQERHTPVVDIRRTRRRNIMAAAAAAAIFILFISSYFIFRNKSAGQAPIARSAPSGTTPPTDRAPGRNLAMLTLANGTQIVLDSSHSGILTNQGNTKIIKLGSGQLAYDASHSNKGDVLYNTISTPRGGQYQVELPDGSQVWLNAASSLHFPTAFKGAQRTVDLTGEAYFEIAKNKAMPFIVRVNGSEVKVLGTHFNINAYSDESLIRTTLLEGSVEITRGRAKGLLMPGQQAQLGQNNEMLKIAPADTEEAVAWKNGFFQFSKSDIGTVMKQVSRWYDLDVEYAGTRPPGHFRGKIGRGVHLSEMLKVLEASGVQFKLEGKTLKVL